MVETQLLVPGCAWQNRLNSQKFGRAGGAKALDPGRTAVGVLKGARKKAKQAINSRTCGGSTEMIRSTTTMQTRMRVEASKDRDASVSGPRHRL